MSLLNQDENVFNLNKPSVFPELTDPRYCDPFFYADLRRDIEWQIVNPNEFARTYVIGEQNHEEDRVVLGVMTQAPTSIESKGGGLGVSLNQMVFMIRREEFEKLPRHEQYRKGGHIFINHQPYKISRIDLDYGFVMMNLERTMGAR